MNSYNLKWDDRLKEIILSYECCRKIYVEDRNVIKQLLKEDISDDYYHLYTYNDAVMFLINTLNAVDNEILSMVVYLFSNDDDAISNAYFDICDIDSLDVNGLSYVYCFNKNQTKFYLDDNIGIIKNYEKCFDDKNFMSSDLIHLRNISKLDFRNGYYYLGDYKYLSEDSYQKIIDYSFDILLKCNGYKESYALLRHVGKYDDIYKTYNKLMNLISNEHREIIGLPMEIFVKGRWNEEDDNKFITYVMIPIVSLDAN